jgi:hypothetical protein
VDVAIGKSVKATFKFYNEFRKQSLARGEAVRPPSYETFSTMAKGLMDASRQVDLDRLKNVSMRDLFERTWAQKLLNYSTQRSLREAYESLMRRY